MAGKVAPSLVNSRDAFAGLAAAEPVSVEPTGLGGSHTAIINPLQPFYEIRALTHAVLPGVKAICRMTGDSFEMEDHRNWTDASYKTYVRPLALPWPYVIPAGTAFRAGER